ncbi:MAG: O-antigen ligase family protein [Myxococcaceae bacterium]
MTAATATAGSRVKSAFGLMFIFGFLVVMAIATSVAIVGGNPFLFAAPAIGVGAVYAVWKMPTKYTALGLIFLMWTADYLPESPQGGVWNSPLHPIGEFLFFNLSAVTGVAALRIAGLDFMVFVLLGVGSLRRALRSKTDPPTTPSVRPLTYLLLMQSGAVVLFDIWGSGTGGNFNESLWQLRQLFTLPLMAMLFLHAISGSHADIRTIGKLAIVAAVWKSLVGMYFFWMIARPSGKIYEFTTSHSDTLLFVPLLGMQLALFFEKPVARSWRDALKWLPIVIYGMILNDRRLAYVSLMGVFLCYMLMYPQKNKLKRGFKRFLILSSPILVMYVAAGWNSMSPVFGGAQLVKSLIKGDQAQAGADYRDIENYDVLYTWSENAIIPLGFGKKFEEPVKLPDISFVMPTYQYHPHNTILWMWTIGGVIGFTFFFAPLMVGVFLAARVFRKATHYLDRVAAMTVIAMVIAHINQCFGDMGTRTYFGSMGCALALAVISKIAVRVGAWPGAAKPEVAPAPQLVTVAPVRG